MNELAFYAIGRPAGEPQTVNELTLVRVVVRPAQRAYAILTHGPLSTIAYMQRRLRFHPDAGAAAA